MEKLLETLRAETPEIPAGPVESAESRRFLSLCRDSGKVVKPLTELCSGEIPSNSLGFGSFAQLPALLGRFAIAVLMHPSEAERSLLQRCGDKTAKPEHVIAAWLGVQVPAEAEFTLERLKFIREALYWRDAAGEPHAI